MINDITLNRFIHHTHPQISQMLRYREFKNINSAFTAAIAEEKALRLTYKETFNQCRICSRTNHTTNNCYRNKSNPSIGSHNNSRPVNFSQIPAISTNSQSQAQPIKQCRYCKNLGHTIEECRKRQYNNAIRQNHNQGPSDTNLDKPTQYHSSFNQNRNYPNPLNSNQEQRNNNNARSANFHQQDFQSVSQHPNPPISMEQATVEFNRFRM